MRVDSESGGVEMCDPAIKLFGTTIGVPETLSIGTRELEKVTTKYEITGKKDPSVETFEENDHNVADATYVQKNVPESIQQTCTLDEKVNTDSNSTDSSKPEPEKSDNSKQEKTLKKPDKVLPCPRCSSMDTKFCYYNNYNINQPRHFCKNCQRYWTAGGTMRNVPVGAGRRKNKNCSLHYQHLVLPSDGMHSPQVENPGLNHYQAPSCGQSTLTSRFKGSKPVLKLGREGPLCESIANVLSLARHEKKGEIIGTLNGQENPKEQSCAMGNPTNCEGREISDKIARPNQNSTPASCNKSAPVHQLQCHPGPHMAYPWCNNPTQMPFCAPAMPYPFIAAPPSLWGCLVGWPSGTWNAPWLGPNGSISPSYSTSNGVGSGNHSPTLGKHCRDSSSIGDEKAEKSLWVPKTLRVDDPEEASKSSIWATLGIKPNPNKPIADGGVFKSFRPTTRDEESKDATQVLHANPAALSRSRTFLESA